MSTINQVNPGLQEMPNHPADRVVSEESKFKLQFSPNQVEEFLQSLPRVKVKTNSLIKKKDEICSICLFEYRGISRLSGRGDAICRRSSVRAWAKGNCRRRSLMDLAMIKGCQGRSYPVLLQSCLAVTFTGTGVSRPGCSHNQQPARNAAFASGHFNWWIDTDG